jgi:hypothetical protein
MDMIKPFGVLLRQLDQLHAQDDKALSFEAGQNFSGEMALDRIGFNNR